MLKKIEFTIINFSFLIIMIYILLLNLLNNGAYTILFSIIFIVIFISIIKKILNSNNEKYIGIVSIIILIFNFVFFIYLGFRLRVSYSWDYGTIQKLALEYANTGMLKTNSLIYLLRYPNNRLITIILSLLFRFLHVAFGIKSVSIYKASSIVLNAIFMGFSYIVTYLLARKIKGEKFAFIVLLFLEFLLPLEAYSAIFYTDTIGLFFFPLILLFYYCYKEKNEKKYLFLIGVFSLIGFEIKATIIFVLLTIIIDIICNNKFRIIFKNIFIITFSFVILYLIFNNGMNMFFNIKKEQMDKYNFPHTHHVMMMLNKTGGYIQEDVNYTASFDTYKEKQKANIEMIEKRIKDRGIGGTINHLFYTKWKRTWTDGSFASYDYLNRGTVSKNIWSNLIPKDGKNYKYYKLYTTVYWLFLIIGMIIAFKDNNENILMIKMIIIIMALFLTIWECNSRYIVQILPLIVLLGICGWFSVLKKEKI